MGVDQWGGGTVTQDRLTYGVKEGLLPVLARFGFELTAATVSDGRSTVECGNGRLGLRLVADWMAGALTLILLEQDGSETSVAVVLGSDATGHLALPKPPRGPTIGWLAKRLRHLAGQLVKKRPALRTDASWDPRAVTVGGDRTQSM